MRRAGILAVAGLYALDHPVERLAEDHSNANFFAGAKGAIPGITLEIVPVEMNLVFYNVRKTGLKG